MHEHSLVRSLLRQAEAIRSAHGDARITEIQLQVGEFSGVEPDLLESAFVELAGEWWTKPVELRLTRVPLTAACNDCGEEFPVQRFEFRCPGCGSQGVTITGGEGLVLEHLRLVSEEAD